jgi:acyl dehydratase
MKKSSQSEANAIQAKLADFFWIHFDAKTAKQVTIYPDMAIPLLKERIKEGLRSPGLLGLYAGAMNDAAVYRNLLKAA